MIDRQGKSLGEHAVEHHTGRPFENMAAVPVPPKKSDDSTQSLREQLKWCSISINNLEELSHELAQAVRIFESQIEQLRSDDYLAEYFNRLLPIFEEFQHRSIMARTHIVNEHILFLHGQKHEIQKKIDDINE